MSDRYIVLPARGIRGSVSVPTVDRIEVAPPPSDSSITHRFTTLDDPSGGPPTIRRVSRPVRVLDKLTETEGAKLVEFDAGSLEAARATVPGARILPERIYHPAVAGHPPLTAPPDADMAPAIDVHVCQAGSETPLSGATVTAMVDAGRSLGATAVTDTEGNAKLAIGNAPVTVERLCVKPPRTGSWGACQTKVNIAGTHTVELQPLDLRTDPLDALRHFYGTGASGHDGRGVRVGVIDTGVDPGHPDLTVAGGFNTVADEPDDRYGDNGTGHGTHVAGIVAAHGAAPNGVRGLAPEAELWSLRVYADNSRAAGSYAIIKALFQAQELGCDIVNLSLELPDDDAPVKDAVADAMTHGVVVIGAAGNGGRQPVASPARYATAVTALGRHGTYPAGSLEESQVATPSGTSAEDFLAGFSNHGDRVGFTAPGLGVVSTVPGGHSPDQGTSMAAAAATGMAARLLSANPDVLRMTRNRQRSIAILELLTENARSMGLGYESEGYGML